MSSDVHVYTYILGSSSLYRWVQIQFVAIRWTEPYVSMKGEGVNDACVWKKEHVGGSSVMVWAGISIHTKPMMVPFQQNLNTMYCKESKVLQPEITPLTARSTQQVLPGHNIRLLDWQSYRTCMGQERQGSQTASPATESTGIWENFYTNLEYPSSKYLIPYCKLYYKQMSFRYSCIKIFLFW